MESRWLSLIPFIETINFSQLLNQAYSHLKQIQFQLQLKDVHETNLVLGSINWETLIQKVTI